MAVVITPIGFIDTSAFTAYYIVKYKAFDVLRSDDGDSPLLKEWKSARALLTRIKNKATEIRRAPVALGRAWIEVLGPQSGTPWSVDDTAYTDRFMRLRIALIQPPGCWSFSGAASAQLAVGQVNAIENRALCSEVNLGDHARVHLIVDIDRPDAG